MLLLKMLRQMRESMLVLADDSDEGGYGGAVMTDTIDVELARHLARERSLGLADVLVNALEGRESQSRPASTEPRVSSSGSRGANSEARAASSPPRAADPDIALPFDAPLTSRFGWRIDPLTQKTRFHGGIDVRAAYGREVPAPTGGRVVFAGEQGSYGLTVVLEHEPGVRSRYAHLSAIGVTEGQVVEKGQVMGLVGSTGRSTAPHLHVELSVNGKRVDPEAAATRLAGIKRVGGDPLTPSLRLGRPVEAY